MRSLRNSVSTAVAGVCLLALVSGCAKAPEKELARARQAIQAAKDAEGDKYMPNNFRNVQKAMEAAQMEITMQDDAFPLTRNYAKSKVLLNNVTDLAEEVAAEAPDAKVKMTADIEAGLASAKKLAEETREDIRKAPRSLGRKVLAQMREDLEAANTALADGESKFAAGDILGAKKNLSDAQGSLKSIFDKLSTGGNQSLM